MPADVFGVPSARAAYSSPITANRKHQPAKLKMIRKRSRQEATNHYLKLGTGGAFGRNRGGGAWRRDFVAGE